jgi:hypothetical protein
LKILLEDVSMTRFKSAVLAIFAFTVFALPSFAEAKTASASSDALLPGLTAIDPGALNNYAGGYSVTTNTTNITANATSSADSYNNSIGGSVATGGISNINVMGNAGLTSTVTNTGNMVSISQSTAINVTLH